MDTIKNFIPILFNNYFVYLFIAFFFAACIILERFKYKKSFSFKERFEYYFFTVIINFGFSIFLATLYNMFLKNITPGAFGFVILVLVSFIAGAVISLIINKLLSLLRKKSFLSFLEDNVVGFGSFLILIIRFILCVPDTVGPWHVWSYAVDTSMGFSSRFLAGQILSLFCKDFVSAKDIYRFCVIVGILLIIITSALLNIVAKKADKKIQPSVLFIIALFITCPISIISLFVPETFGKLEIFGLILSLVSVYLFNKIRNTPLKYAVITILSVLSIVFYQGNVFLYYNIVLVIMIYDVIGEKKIDVKKAVYGSLSVLISLIAFIRMQLFNTIIFNNADEMIAALQKRTDVTIDRKPIQLEYFSSMKSSYDLVTNFLGYFIREKFLLQIILLIPVLFTVLYVVFKFLNTSNNTKTNSTNLKVRNILSFLTIYLVVPQFVLNVDWGRWMISITVFLFFFILYFAYKGDCSMNNTLESISVMIKKKPYIAVLLIIYASMFNLVEATICPDISKFISFFLSFFN